MTVVEPGSGGAKIVERVKNIILKPGATWEVIDTEPATVGGLYKGYVIPLAAIPAVCGLIGMSVIGVGAMGFSYRVPIVSALISSLVGFVLTLAMVYVLSLVIDALAPKFQATRSQIQAFKLAAYSGTAAWVAGVLMLIPMLGILAALAGLYSLYTFYVGLPKLMKPPEEKKLVYFLSVIGVMIVIGIVVAVIYGALGLGSMRGPMGVARQADTITIPGDHTIDLGKLEAQARKAEAAAKAMQSGEATAADPEVLKAYLPAAVAGYARTGLSAEGNSAGGLATASAEAKYEKGDARIRLSVTDMGAASALAGLAGAFNVKSSKEENGRYEKVGQVDGRMTQESWDSAQKSGEYSVMVGDKFLVRAAGEGASMDELRAAVRAVDFGRLEAAAKAAG